MSAFDPASKFYLAINGQPQGPYTAPMVINLLQQGTIDGSTLICADGGAAWVPVQEIAASLWPGAPPVVPSVVPPVMPAAVPAGESGGTPPAPLFSAAPARTQAAARQSEMTTAEKPDKTKGLRLTGLLAALIFFFLPWIEFRCAGERYYHQSGFQAALNTASIDDALRKTAMTTPASANMDLDAQLKAGLTANSGHAILTGVAMAAVVLALLSAAGKSRASLSGWLALIALACLGFQAAMDFPFEKALSRGSQMFTDGVVHGYEQARARDVDLSSVHGIQPGTVDPATTAMMGQLTSGKSPFDVKYSLWFYGELILLGLVIVLGFTAGGGKRRR